MTPNRHPILLLASATLLTTSAAWAEIVPLIDLRQNHAKAVYEGLTEDRWILPPSPFLAWDTFEVATASDGKTGHASATTYQNSQLYRDLGGLVTGFYHAGTTAGEFQGGTGSYEALSLSTMVFRLTTTSDYFLDATFDVGDLMSDGEILLGNPHGAGHLIEVNSGHVILQGRLAPGDYFIEGRSQVTTHGPSIAGPTYAIFLTAQQTNSPIVQVQPSDIVIPPGGSSNFTVWTNPAPGTVQDATAAFTFQWRKNGVPLTNGGHYSGVDTPTLSITNASMPDTGWYNVIVTSGTVQEPSSYARLSLGVTAVGPPLPTASLDFALEAAMPNPSASTTSFRFSAARSMDARAVVYDASGRRVRSLANGALSGTGTLTWDGRSESGDRVPAGIYFLHVDAGGEKLIRRFVRMR